MRRARRAPHNRYMGNRTASTIEDSTRKAPPGSELTISRKLDVAEVHWQAVKLQLMGRQGLAEDAAEARIAGFLKHFSRPCNLYWYLAKSRTENDQLLQTACVCHSGDEIEIVSAREYRFAFLSLAYRQSLRYSLKAKDLSVSNAVRLLGLSFRINSLIGILLFDAALILAALVFYIVLIGCFIYGTAVFVLFLKEPAHTTVVATKSASVGAALLCYLLAGTVLLRAILGHFLKKIERFASRRRKRNSAAAKPAERR